VRRREVSVAFGVVASAIPQNRVRVQQLKDLLIAYYGRGDARLGQFGVRSRPGPRPLSPEAKVLRAQRVRDTRALRHTLGKRQRAAIKTTAKYSLSVEAASPPSAGDAVKR
jgi:hypothetical protein